MDFGRVWSWCGSVSVILRDSLLFLDLSLESSLAVGDSILLSPAFGFVRWYTRSHGRTRQSLEIAHQLLASTSLKGLRCSEYLVEAIR